MNSIILDALKETNKEILEILENYEIDRNTIDLECPFSHSKVFNKVEFNKLMENNGIHDVAISTELLSIFTKFQTFKNNNNDFSADDDYQEQHEYGHNNCFSSEKIYYNEEKQHIDGFGVFAGRGNIFYQDKNRESILADLFSKDGLNLSIARMEIDYNYQASELDEPINQYWVVKNAKEKYNINKIFASIWSPPTYMKTIPGQLEGKNCNRLNPNYDDAFCEYISNICEDLEKIGISLYSISPMNEPEFPTPSWAGTIWYPTDTARFIPKLKDTLNKKGMQIKMIMGECANWFLSDVYTFSSLFLMWLKGTSKKIDICASHGYTIPNFISGETDVTYNQKAYDWVLNRSSKPRWITEISETTKFDPSMKKGLEFAASLHNFLTKGNISAFTFWLGVEKISNECLIKTDGDTYSKGKVFDIYGNYTRYINPGSIRINTSKNKSHNGVLYSAFKNPNEKNSLTIVAINNNYHINELKFEVIGSDINILTPYVTSEGKNNNWIKLDEIKKDKLTNTFTIQLPSYSVVTLKNN
ncbi:MAG: glycoside hydrolase [Candidatus Arsenophonus phytopathogenicus]